MNDLSIQGFIISKIDYGDSSEIIKLFSEDYGIISLLARGSKKDKSGLLLASQLFVEVIIDVQLRQNEAEFNPQNMHNIKKIRIINSYFNLRNKIERIYIVSRVSEIILKLGYPDTEEKLLYILFKNFINTIQNSDKIACIRLLSSFLIKFLCLSGIRPIFNISTLSGKRINIKDRIYFSFEEGGAILEEEKFQVKNYIKINLDEILEIKEEISKNFTYLSETSKDVYKKQYIRINWIFERFIEVQYQVNFTSFTTTKALSMLELI